MTRSALVARPPELLYRLVEEVLAIDPYEPKTHIEVAQSLMKQNPAFFGIGVGQSLDNPREAAMVIYVDRTEVSASLPATINGLRTRDLQALLFSAPAGSEKEKRRRSAAISRKIRILRAHGLLQKVPRTHRHQVTTAARKAITALLTATQATLAQLSSLAA